MVSNIVGKIPDMTDAQLDQLENNALARRHGAQSVAAAEILTAIIEERSARKKAALADKIATLDLIKERTANMPFQKRVEAAFTEAPPADWEKAALAVLASHPGATTERLSGLLGYSGTYMNWFGMVCVDRQPWLGPATADLGEKLVYSRLLCELETSHDPNTGRTVTRWRLKDDAYRALKRIGIVP